MKRFLLLLVTICSIYGRAQKIYLVTESDIPGIVITRSDIYEGEDLNDYLSGAADLYLEYGFRKLFVSEYILDHDKATLEVYVMGDSPSAFGIYSLSVSRCLKWNIFGSFSCITPNQVAAVSGNLFIYAGNPSGSPSAQSFCEQLVKMIIDKNPQEPWYAPPLAQSAKAAPFTNTLRYFRGSYGIRKGLPYWSRIFENLSFEMYTINITTKEFTAILARITFPDVSSLSTFIMNAGLDAMATNGSPVLTSNGMYRSWYKITNVKIVFLESNSGTVNIREFIPVAPEVKW